MVHYISTHLGIIAGIAMQSVPVFFILKTLIAPESRKRIANSLKPW